MTAEKQSRGLALPGKSKSKRPMASLRGFGLLVEFVQNRQFVDAELGNDSIVPFDMVGICRIDNNAGNPFPCHRDLSHTSKACWVGFWLYDTELDGLVQDIMSDYKVWHTERSDGYLLE